jgi:predicted metalloprotease with PDZ domain
LIHTCANIKKHNNMGHSKSLLAAIAILGAAMRLAYAADGAGPSATWPSYPISPPQDRAFPGDIQLSVDATDITRRVVRIHETVTAIGADTVLLYPKWLPGTHAPEGPIDKIAGIRITSGGTPVPWTRDPVDVYAFRVHAGAGVHTIDIDFEYLSPTSSKVGALEISRDLLMLEWNELVLYPAGYFARQIPVQANLTLPADWQSASALETTSANAGRTSYKPVNLETLIDSPVYAGRYAKIFDLDPGGSVPVQSGFICGPARISAVQPEQLAAYRALVQQAYKLYGSHHYAHYDFLYSLSDQIQFNGLEHHQSSEDGTDPEAFTKWDKSAYARDLLPHEFYSFLERQIPPPGGSVDAELQRAYAGQPAVGL